MGNSVDKVCLKQPENKDFSCISFLKKDTPVSIFSAKNHDDAMAQSERIADKRLEELARKAIEINDEYSNKYWQLWALFIPSMRMNSEWNGELVAGKLKQKAFNTLVQSKTNVPVDPQNLPDFKKDLNQILDGMCYSTPLRGFSEEETKKLAQKVFGNNSKKQVFFTIIPEDIGANISMYEATVNSEKYNSLADERGNFKGLQLKGYEIPKTYKTFLEMLIEGKEDISSTEAKKLLDTIKALETVNAFNKNQQKGSANSEKEDLDIFDVSDDGLLNRGDISAMELFIKIGTNKEFAEKLAVLKAQEWNSLKTMRTVAGLTDKKARELFDLDGNGNVDMKDYDLYKKILDDPDKFDIDGDKFVDEKDITLIKEYFKAILQRAKEDKIFRKNTEEIIGSTEQMENLQKKIYK